MTMKAAKRPLFDPSIVRAAALDALRKLDPRVQVRNPVMFTVFVGSMLTTLLFFQALFGHGEAAPGFILAISLWLWFTVLFANFAEAMAEGRGKLRRRLVGLVRLVEVDDQEEALAAVGAQPPGS